MIALREVESAGDVEIFRELLRIYAAENAGRFSERMTQDLLNLPGRYAPPTGGLWLANHDGADVATAAWTRVDDEQAELKRVYVLPAARGRGAARALSLRVIELLRAKGYGRVVLNTWDDNRGAIELYRSIGFVEIAPFKPPTFPNMVFMGFALTHAAA
jgi:ribosomal protein S18 acetylase RimI-like enzyme